MIVNAETRDNSTISRNVYDFKNGNIIPAIASFDDKGVITPLYFRIDGESYKVLDYNLTDNAKQRAEYICSINDGGIKKRFKVQYWYAEAKWVMRY